MARFSMLASILALAILSFATASESTTDPTYSGPTSSLTSESMASMAVMTEIITTTALGTPVTVFVLAPAPPRLPPCLSPPTTYIVIQLDTVEKIAAKFNISVDALEAANSGKVQNWDLLQDGTQLFIPPNFSAACPGWWTSGVPSTFSTVISSAPASISSSAASISPASVSPASVSSSVAPAVTPPADTTDMSSSQQSPTGPVTAWTIASGDTGEEIASEVSVPFFAISSANPTVSWNAITVGQTITIPPSPTAPEQVTSTQQISTPTHSGSYTAWTVESGDTGLGIASDVSVPFFAILSANPTVTWTAISVGQTITIPPSPTALSQVTGTLAEKNPNLDNGSAIVQSNYKQFDGDGSASAGWPSMDEWASFDAMWGSLLYTIGFGCGTDVPQNSYDENADLKKSILSISAQTYLDPRFILAAVTQESNGCVRVMTTAMANPNPGLLQSFNGKGSCNHNGTLDNPCPPPTIDQMIADGVAAPIDGVTLVKALNQAAEMPNCEPAQAYYRAARFYNSGPESLPDEAKGDLGSAVKGATLCYASDIANRLTGWSNGRIGSSPCTLDKKN